MEHSGSEHSYLAGSGPHTLAPRAATVSRDLRRRLALHCSFCTPQHELAHLVLHVSHAQRILAILLPPCAFLVVTVLGEHPNACCGALLHRLSPQRDQRLVHILLLVDVHCRT